MKSIMHNNFGKTLLVEDCQQVSVTHFVQSAKQQLKLALLEAALEYKGLDVQLTTSTIHHNGIRYWFSCPLCHKRVGMLYVHPLTQVLGCRTCLHLSYRKSRFKGMIENM